MPELFDPTEPKEHGFSRQRRLKGRSEIGLLFKKGRYASFGYLKFRYLHQREKGVKVVISVSKRVGNAPCRNRLKRLIREALRLSGNLDGPSLNCGIYVVEPPPKKPTLFEIRGFIEEFFSTISKE